MVAVRNGNPAIRGSTAITDVRRILEDAFGGGAKVSETRCSGEDETGFPGRSVPEWSRSQAGRGARRCVIPFTHLSEADNPVMPVTWLSIPQGTQAVR